MMEDIVILKTWNWISNSIVENPGIAYGGPEEEALDVIHTMIHEAFGIRGWELERIIDAAVSCLIEEDGVQYTTFACIAQWGKEN